MNEKNSRLSENNAGLPVMEALASRRSVRAFRSEQVSIDLVKRILESAARSPSASNIQPWRVHVCTGAVKTRLSEELIRLHNSDSCNFREEQPYYPKDWTEPYLSRRRQVGKTMYGLLEIPKGDTEAMKRQYARNYAFFDAPVGLFYTIDRRLTSGNAVWMDLGSYMHGVMLAARNFGIDTCAQQAFAKFHQTIRMHLPITENEILVCGMSLGYADTEHVVNQLRTEREPLESFVTFSGFQSGDK